MILVPKTNICLHLINNTIQINIYYSTFFLSILIMILYLHYQSHTNSCSRRFDVVEINVKS